MRVGDVGHVGAAGSLVRWGGIVLCVLLCVALGASFAHAGALSRTSRPGAGTVVGITIAGAVPSGAVDAAYAAISTWEAELSEWHPGSATRRVMGGASVEIAVEAWQLLDLAEELRVRTGGAFSIVRLGGPLVRTGASLSAPPGTSIDLGGVLKGFLADRAADALLEHGVADFVVDAGGDIVAHGSSGAGRAGWPVTVAVAGVTRTVRLQDEAVSTSGEDQQPDHIVDRRTGEPIHTLRGVFVRASQGALADGLATAVYASGGHLQLPAGQCVYEVREGGRVSRVCD